MSSLQNAETRTMEFLAVSEACNAAIFWPTFDDVPFFLEGDLDFNVCCTQSRELAELASSWVLTSYQPHSVTRQDEHSKYYYIQFKPVRTYNYTQVRFTHSVQT